MKTSNIAVPIDVETRETVRRLAYVHRCSMAEVVRRALTLLISNERKREGNQPGK